MVFLDIETFSDLASFLNMEPKNLGYILYKLPRKKLYESFAINKKNGSKRKIDSPIKQLKKLQEKIKHELDKIYKPHKSAMGFIKNKSIVTNAKFHSNKKWVVNVDLNNYFNTITSRRVYGLFRAKPFSFNKKIASVLSNIVTYKGSLPQGAVTSPVISNMISYRLDRQLERYCFRKDIVYTRYVDDIAFSCNESFKLNYIYNDINNKMNKRIIEIIERNGFTINNKKIRCNFYYQHQDVTGIKVNKKPNIKSFLKYQTRAMLHSWSKYGLTLATKDFMKKNIIKKKPKNEEKLFVQYLQGKISFISMVLGKENSFYNRIALEFNKLSKSNTFKVNYEVEDVHEYATFSFIKTRVKGAAPESVSVTFHSYGKFIMCLHSLEDTQLLLDIGSKKAIINHVEKILQTSQIENIEYKDGINLDKAIIVDLSVKRDILIFKIPDVFIPYSYNIKAIKPDRRKAYTINYIDDNFNSIGKHSKLGSKRKYRSWEGYTLKSEIPQGWSGSPVVKKGTNNVVGYITYGFDGSEEFNEYNNGMFDFIDIDIMEGIIND